MKISRHIIIALLIYFSMLTMLGFLFIIIYQTPSLSGNLANLSVLPGWILLFVLWGISVLTVISVSLMNVSKRAIIAALCVTILFSSGSVLIKELVYGYRRVRFFGEHGRGKIVFLSEFRADDAPKVIYLSGRGTGKFQRSEHDRIHERNLYRTDSQISPNGKYLLESRKGDSRFGVFKTEDNQRISILQHWVISSAAVSWSPNSKFIVYDYAYDRDDLSKIFAANIETGETILLAAGKDPIWVE